MGKRSKAKKNGARVLGLETLAEKGYVTRDVIEEHTAREAQARQEKTAGEKLARRNALRAAANNPWPTKVPTVIDLARSGAADMQRITADFNRDIREIREEEKRAEIAAKTKRAS